MTKKLSLKELPVKGKKVLMRVDFNVPLDKQGQITDDSRIKAALPSINYILENGGFPILMSHLGRPKGVTPNLSLAPCAKRLSELLNKKVILAPDCVGSAVENLIAQMNPGNLLLLENLRFHNEEEKPELNPSFVEQLAKWGDLYVNDAFGTAHRAHSSTAIIAKFFPHKSAAGFLMEKEIKFLGETLLNPKKPFFAIIGGAKISSKLGVLKSLVKKADALFIGGGMAYTFLKAQGISIGNSIHEDDQLEQAKAILAESQKGGAQIYLPLDLVIVEKVDNQSPIRIIDVKNGIPDHFEGVDIGPKTIELFLSSIQKAATVFWNGPVGVFEINNFAKGTFAIANGLAKLPKSVITIVGGGESVAALEASGVSDQMTHVSTGGGATLEYIEQGTLPGIEALSDKV